MKIKNSPYKNIFGEGHEKEITTNDGKKYVVKNSPYRNIFGEGHEQIIEEKKDTSWFFELPLLSKLCAVLFLISCVFFLTSIATFEILKIVICFLVTALIGIAFMMVTFGKYCSYKDTFIISLQILGYILIGIAAMVLIPLIMVLIFNGVMRMLI